MKNRHLHLIATALVAGLLLTGCGASQEQADEGGNSAPNISATPTPSATSASADGEGHDVLETETPVADGGYVAPVSPPAGNEPTSDAGQGGGTNGNEGTSNTGTQTGLQTLLAQLPVAAAQTSGYNRDLFNYWITQGDGCDTRQHVLADQVQNGTTRSCITTGTWLSIYDGRSITDAGTLDIDHMVPLSEAWQSGAWEWDAATREAFANDLNFDPALIAVTAGTNRAKGDKDPSAWMPPNSAYHCDYARDWMLVKYRWSLTIDQAEQTALNRLASACPSTTYTLPTRATVTEDSNAGQPAPAQPPAQGGSTGGNDPQFGSCKDAKAAGFGPYVRGTDPEYDWYRDGDSDGTVCE